MLSFIFVGIISIFTDNLYFDIPLTSLAFFLPKGYNSFIEGVTKHIEIFSIWRYCLIAIGISIVNKKKKSDSYGLVIAIFVISLLIGGINDYFKNIYMNF